MSFKQNIQQKLAGVFGKEEENTSRNKRVYNYNEADSMALLFYLEDEEQYNIIRQYIKFVKEEYAIKDVKALCFVDDKESPEFIQSRIDFDFFKRQEVNWQQKATGTLVQNFIDIKYNILIDLSDGTHQPLNSITAASNASFKIGKSDIKNMALYDVLIDMKDNQKLKPYLDQINHYLTLINT